VCCSEWLQAKGSSKDDKKQYKQELLRNIGAAAQLTIKMSTIAFCNECGPKQACQLLAKP